MYTLVLMFKFSPVIDQQFKPFLSKFSTQDEGEQVLDSLYEFRTPRNAILVIASEFISTSKKRLREMNGKNNAQIPNLALDYESIQVKFYSRISTFFIPISRLSILWYRYGKILHKQHTATH